MAQANMIQAYAMPARGLVKVNTMAAYALFVRGLENERNNMGLPTSPDHCHLPCPCPCQLVEQLILLAALLAALVAVLLNL
jgi:hypothetical protein